MKRYIALLSLPLLFTACSGSNSSDDKVTSQSLSYSFDDNGCKTERHTFSSFEARCAGLKDDALNHYCAYNMRKEEYKRSQCFGDFASRSKTVNPTPTNPEKAEEPGPTVRTPTPTLPIILPTPVTPVPVITPTRPVQKTALDAHLILLRPLTADATECKVESATKLVDLAPAKIDPSLLFLRLELSDSDETAGLKNMEFKFSSSNYAFRSRANPTLTATAEVMEKIKTDLEAGSDVFISAFDTCKDYQGNAVSKVEETWQIDNGQILNDQQVFALYEWDKQKNECAITETIMVAQLKTELLLSQNKKVEISLRSKMITGKKGEVLEFTARDEGGKKFNFAKSYEIVADMKDLIELKNKVAEGLSVTTSIDKRCREAKPELINAFIDVH